MSIERYLAILNEPLLAVVQHDWDSLKSEPHLYLYSYSLPICILPHHVHIFKDPDRFRTGHIPYITVTCELWQTCGVPKLGWTGRQVLFGITHYLSFLWLPILTFNVVNKPHWSSMFFTSQWGLERPRPFFQEPFLDQWVSTFSHKKPHGLKRCSSTTVQILTQAKPSAIIPIVGVKGVQIAKITKKLNPMNILRHHTSRPNIKFQTQNN